jgi:hypothetical protein
MRRALHASGSYRAKCAKGKRVFHRTHWAAVKDSPQTYAGQDREGRRTHLRAEQRRRTGAAGPDDCEGRTGPENPGENVKPDQNYENHLHAAAPLRLEWSYDEA